MRFLTTEKTYEKLFLWKLQIEEQRFLVCMKIRCRMFTTSDKKACNIWWSSCSMVWGSWSRLSLVLYVFEFLMSLIPLVLFHPIPKLATERFLITLYFCVENNLFSMLFLIFGAQLSPTCGFILRKNISKCSKQCVEEWVFRV